ncbi:MAG: STAS domain-containing protein [Myxococcota bacterium]|nr:STAS domain-containing protein [Myxococcota bacterium]
MTAPLSIHREENDTTLILRLEGTFDAKTAAQLRTHLEQLQKQEVVLDFSRVQKFVDSAVAVLTGGLDCSTLRLRGLDRHGEAMFRYFGVASSRSTQRAYYTPEDILFV